MNHSEKFSRFLIWLIVALVLAAALKGWLVAGGYVPFNSDEAVVALMARHILLGERPVFFYGQAYMGSLDAWLVALGFLLFGEQVWVIRLVQGLLYVGVLLTTVQLGKRAFGSWQVGIVTAALLAIPAVNVTLYTTVSLGGYGEALLLGNLTLLVGLRIANAFELNTMAQVKSETGPYWLWMLLGFLTGLGLWAFGLTLIYSLPVDIYVVVSLVRVMISGRRQPLGVDGATASHASRPPLHNLSRGMLALAALVAGALLGAAPWWGFALQHGFSQLLWELQGGAIAGVERLPWLLQVGQHLLSLLVLGSTVTFGMRPPWEFAWLALPLLPFVLIFWLAVLLHIPRSLREAGAHRPAQGLLLGVMLTLAAGFIFTSFGADPSGRYFIPLAVPLALFAASLILDARQKIGKLAYALLALVLVYNLWGTLQCALRFPPGITTQFYAPARLDHRYDQELIDFLHQQGEQRGYSNYWVAYPLGFLSQEELIFVPRLPYHQDFRYTERDDRYDPYDRWVAEAQRVAYITANHPALDERLRAAFAALGVTWKEAKIGDFQIFFALSQPVRPEQIGLGVNAP